MGITAITIENFKGIKRPIRIELKPITLLFGPNSAGKSTIVQAIHYANEIIENQKLSPDLTSTGGDSVDLGGFANFVHNHDLTLPIRFRFEFGYPKNFGFTDHTVDEFAWLAFESETAESDHFLYFYNDMAKDTFKPWLEITICWDNDKGKPVIRSYKTGFGAKLFAKIITNIINKTEEKVLSYLDLKSPVFFTNLKLPGSSTKAGQNIVKPYLKQAIIDEEKNNLDLKISYNGILPLPGFIDFPDLKGWHPHGMPNNILFKELKNFKQLLSSLLISPMEYLRKELKKFRYIGPLRKVPKRKDTQISRSQLSWSDGLAAWNMLQTQHPSININEVNEWILKRFKTGYCFESERYKEVDITDLHSQKAAESQNKYEKLNLQDQLAPFSAKTRLQIRDKNRGIYVSPADIGVGISQMLPVIVLALAFEQGVLSIEQPELHIHPALQVALGDLFIEKINSDDNINGGRIFLLETHSEHLMLRLLRRVRETGCRKVKKCQRLTPTDLCIYFIEQEDSGVSCLSIRIDEEGDFIDHWPKGFFDERAEELF